MGNRAVIAFSDKPSDVGIYLHWNGGRDSVEAALEVAKQLNVRTPGYDKAYAISRLVQIFANFFGGTTCIGVGKVNELDYSNADNGTYVIGDNWEIIKRKHFKGEEQRNHDHLETMIAFLEPNVPFFRAEGSEKLLKQLKTRLNRRKPKRK